MLVTGGAWLFDNLDQRLFSLVRTPALSDLMHLAPGDPAVQAFGKSVTAVFLIGWGLGGLTFGTLGDRFGPVRVLSLSILFYSVGTAASALSPDEHAFMVLRFVTGFGIGGVFGLAAAIIAGSFDGAARIGMLALLQILSTVGNIGAALVKMAVDQASAHPSNWRIVFALGGLPLIFAVIGLLRLREPEKWVRAQADHRLPIGVFGPYRALLADRAERRNLWIGALLAGAGVIGLWGVGEYTIDLQDILFRRYYAAHAAGGDVAALTASAKNLAYLLQMIGAAVGMGVFAWAAARYGRRPTFMVAYALAFGMTVFTYAFLDTPTDAYWMAPLMGAAQFSVFVGFSLYLPELFSVRSRATGVSFCYNLGRFAAAGGSLVSATLSTRVFAGFAAPLPLRYSAIVMSAVFLVGIVAALLGPETGERDRAW